MLYKLLLFLAILPAYAIHIQGQEGPLFRKGLEATEPEDKIVYFTQSLWHEGETVQKHLLRAEAYINLGWEEHAISDYDRAISIDKKNLQLYYDRIGLYLVTGRLDEAITDYTTLLDMDPSRNSVYINRGILYVYAGQEEQACADFTKAIETDPAALASALRRTFIDVTSGEPSGENAAPRPIGINALAAQWKCQALYKLSKYYINPQN